MIGVLKDSNILVTIRKGLSVTESPFIATDVNGNQYYVLRINEEENLSQFQLPEYRLITPKIEAF